MLLQKHVDRILLKTDEPKSKQINPKNNKKNISQTIASTTAPPYECAIIQTCLA
jgi:hypothetical protein